MNFYIVDFHENTGEEWYLDDPEVPLEPRVDPWYFTSGLRYDGYGPISVRVISYGPRPNVTFTTRSVPVVDDVAKDIIQKSVNSDVDFHPVHLSDGSGDYWIANFFRIVDCLDPKRSNAMKYTRNTAAKPKGNQMKRYMFVCPLVIFEDQIPRDVSAFRVEGWSGLLIVTGDVMRKWREAGLTGLSFEQIETTRKRQPWYKRL